MKSGIGVSSELKTLFKLAAVDSEEAQDANSEEGMKMSEQTLSTFHYDTLISFVFYEIPH